MTEPLAWTTVGILGATLMGSLTFVLTSLQRTIAVQIGGVRNEMIAMRGEVNGQLAGFRGQLDGLRGEMDAKFQAVNLRLDSVDRRLDNLDRGFDALTKRAFGSGRE